MYRRFVIVMLLFQLTFAYTHASEKLKFNYLTTSDGLSNNYVTDVLEDSDGFLWFSTSDGLNKWNGYEFEIFKNDSENLNSLSSNFILSLAQDHDSNIWIGTNQTGVVRYNMLTEQFYRYSSSLTNSNAVPSTYIRKIIVSADSLVWVASDLGLAVYQPEQDNFKQIKFDTESDQEYINNMFPDKSGNVVFQTNKGVFIYNTMQKSFSLFELKGLAQIEFQNAPMCFASNQQLWIGTESGLIKYELSKGTYKRYTHSSNISGSISSQVFSCIYEDSQHNIWIGTKDGGVNLYHPETDHFSIYKAGNFNGSYLSNNIITQIFEDGYKNVWFATQEGGLSYFNANESIFQFFDHQPDDNSSISNSKVSAFIQDANDRVWIGTGNGGLNLMDTQNNGFTHYQLQSNTVAPSILGMHATKDDMYLTGWGVGLQRFNFSSKKFYEVTAPEGEWPNKIPQNIKGLGVDDQGNIWLANHTTEGLFIYETKSGKIYNALNPGSYNSQILSVPYAVDMVQDSRGRIWIISYTGLYLFDGNYHRFVYNSGDSGSISSNYNYTLFESSDSSIWIGNTKGLERLYESNGEFRFEHYSQKFQLPDNIKGIVEDNNKNLWLSANEGLVMFDPNTGNQRLFHINRDVPGQEFFERSCMKTHQGELYFGTTNGFYKFNPDSLRLDNASPKIFLSGLKIFNETQQAGAEGSPLHMALSKTKEITLSYKQSVIAFEYVALDLDNPGKAEYAYFMEGINRDWNFVGNKRFANYTNLSPGEYTFRVRTATGNQLSQNNEASIKVIIKPPFWRTTLAYILYVVAFLLILFFIQLVILNRIKLLNDLKLEKLKIQNVQESNLMKLRFFTNISHEFRTPLTLIKAPLEKLLDKGNEMNVEDRKYHYQLILNSTQKMQSMVNQLMDYRKLEAGSLVLEPSMGDLVAFCRTVFDNFNYLAQQKQIKYTFNSATKKLFFAFDQDKLDKVLSNILSNAFKNTPDGGLIHFSLKLLNADEGSTSLKNVSLSIKDNGRGIAASDLPHIFERFYMVSGTEVGKVQGTGIGLALAKELVELHGGTLLANSEPGKGAEFVVTIPFKEDELNYQSRHEEAMLKQLKPDIVSTTSEVDTEQRKRARVLVVEDDEELAGFIAHELSDQYEVLMAKNGMEGLQMIKDEQPDLVISDVMMPEMNGIEMCRNIKTAEQTSHIPVVLLTARHSQQKELEGFESGADAYILKPFNLQILLTQVANLLQVRQNIKDKFRNGTSLFFNDEGIESKDQQLMQEIIDLVIEHISLEKINAAFIAEKMHMSRSLIYIKIEALTGQTVNEFVRSIRLKKALQLLSAKELTITEIAYAVGFSSQSYFTRSFVKQFGSSPTNYQKNTK